VLCNVSMPKPKKLIRAEKAAERPTYFLVYSTGEPQISVFIECLEMVFANHFDLKRTPVGLESDRSQHDVIVELIEKCAFGVVCLDGLRPNVVFEYGALRGAKKPVLLFKEALATVDIGHFYGDAPELALPSPLIDVDRHFSDTKDRYHVSWSRFEIRKTVKTIWEEYRKRKAEIHGYIEIPEPKI
jgi:hypothetical protein